MIPLPGKTLPPPTYPRPIDASAIRAAARWEAHYKAQK